jgi:hypothetical protein
MDKLSDNPETFHKVEWYGTEANGILAVWEYVIVEPGTNRLSVDLYPFNDTAILGTFVEKQNNKISVIRALGGKQLVIRTDEVAMTPKQFDLWFRALALAIRLREAIENNRIKRACPETGWLDGRAPTSKEECLTLASGELVGKGV